MLKLVTIALGFSAIALFAGYTHAGYTHNICSGMSRGAIHGEMLGHLTLSRPGKSQEGKLNPDDFAVAAGPNQYL